MIKEKVQALLTTEFTGRNILCLDSVDSTNNYLLSMAGSLPEGYTVTAEEQTAGKGRRGRSWVADRGFSILASVLFKPGVKPELLSFITSVASISIVRAIADETGLPAMIKWPNDVYLDGMKLGGILAENAWYRDGQGCVILGMGINVNQQSFPEDISDVATSLRITGGREYNREVILAGLLNDLENNYRLFLREGSLPFIDELKNRSCVLGERVRVTGTDPVIEGRAIDITDEGFLLVREHTGEMHILSAGDVSVRTVREEE